MARAYASDPLFGYVVHIKETNREEVLRAIFKVCTQGGGK